jgi:hypothetical protein
VRKRLDQHHCPFGIECPKRMRCCTNRIAHAMQTVKEGHQVVVLARKVLCGGDFKANVIQSRFPGVLVRVLN